MLLTCSLILNALLLGILGTLFLRDPTLVKLAPGVEIRSSELRATLLKKEGAEALGDLIGRRLVQHAAEDRGLSVDPEEFEDQWRSLLQEPDVRGRLDAGESTEESLRADLETLLLLDRLTWDGIPGPIQQECLEQFFQTHSRELAKVRLKHILVDREETAREVASRLEVGVEFEGLAGRFSLDPISREVGGDIGWKRRRDLPPEIAQVAFILPVGKASRPIATEYGWHLFYIEERSETFEELLKDTRRALCAAQRPSTLRELKKKYGLDELDLEGTLSRMRWTLQ